MSCGSARGPRRPRRSKLAISLGGFITGEHGIGLTRKKFLSLGLDSAQIELMRKIKESFDPRYLLNPGKIFA
jgi:glycolate oxidase